MLKYVLSFIIFFLFSSIGYCSWTVDGNVYPKRKTITILKTYVDADLTNFPVRIYINGDTQIGAVCKANGDDLRFTSSDGSTLLYAEKDGFSVTGGSATGNFWVQVPVVSHSADTVIYVYYGNSGASAQSSPSSVWDANFAAVWHLPDGSSLTANDSKSTNNGTITSTTAGAGMVNGAGVFSGSPSKITCGNNSSLNPTSALTISAWVNVGAVTNYHTVVSRWQGTHPYILDIGSGGIVALDINNDSAVASGGTNVLNSWHFVTGTYDKTGTNNLKIYVDGLSDGTPINYTASLTTSGANTVIGTNVEGPTGRTANGSIDEVRISNIARPAEWIKFEYHNIVDTGNCLTFGSDVTGPIKKVLIGNGRIGSGGF